MPYHAGHWLSRTHHWMSEQDLNTAQPPACCALIPLKRRGHSKSRLAGVLASAEREQLVQAMFTHVLGAVRASRSVTRVAILSPDLPAALVGMQLCRDEGRGLNLELRAAHAQLRTLGIRQLLILPADLPTLSAADIDALVCSGQASGFALAPDGSGDGTNGLYLGDVEEFGFQFGEGSGQKHLLEAQRLGLGRQVLRAPGFEFDVDLPADLRQWEHQSRWQCRYA
jgi:2-phospho-L-lactate/phosphoenolpyruvate guanylyltransferase